MSEGVLEGNHRHRTLGRFKWEEAGGRARIPQLFSWFQISYIRSERVLTKADSVNIKTSHI